MRRRIVEEPARGSEEVGAPVRALLERSAWSSWLGDGGGFIIARNGEDSAVSEIKRRFFCRWFDMLWEENHCSPCYFRLRLNQQVPLVSCEKKNLSGMS